MTIILQQYNIRDCDEKFFFLFFCQFWLHKILIQHEININIYRKNITNKIIIAMMKNSTINTKSTKTIII